MPERPIAEIKQLLLTETLPALGPESRAETLSESVLNRKLDSLLADAAFSSPRQQLIRALLLLWHDHLEASHVISQGIETGDGSFVHAMMHRREPDYWNSKYWWRRTGRHPAFTELGRRVGNLLEARGAGELKGRLLAGGEWDPDAFVDFCEAASRDPQSEGLLREIQRVETEVLLDHFLTQ